MTPRPAYLDRARAALEEVRTETPDEIRNKSDGAAAEPLLALRADVLALAQARGYPDLAVDELRLSGADQWHALIAGCEAASLIPLRDELLAAQRRDGPERCGAITL